MPSENYTLKSISGLVIQFRNRLENEIIALL